MSSISGSATLTNLLAALRAYPDGASAAVIAAQLGLNVDSVAARLSKAFSHGKINRRWQARSHLAPIAIYLAKP